MKLLFIHGPPASGKLTIAKAVLNHVAGRLLDNHVPIDFARSLFEFGVPKFWDLADAVRLLAVEKAAEAKLPLLITTGCYSDPDDRPILEKFEAILGRHAGELLPVYLSCPVEVLRTRVTAAERVARSKLCSVDGLNSFVEKLNTVQVPRENCLTVDSATLSADSAARKIIEHWRLG